MDKLKKIQQLTKNHLIWFFVQLFSSNGHSDKPSLQRSKSQQTVHLKDETPFIENFANHIIR